MRRSVLLAKMATVRRLPAEYARVEYLESTGTQWIDTGYYPNSNTRFYLDAICKSESYILGAMATAQNRYSLNGYNGGEFYHFASETFFTLPLNTRTVVKYADTTLTVNTTIYSVSMPAGKKVDLPMYLFGCSAPQRPRSYPHRIYLFGLYDNTVPVRDFVPVVRLSDMKPGLYDYVTEQFFVNQGTGEFKYGPYIEPLPDVPGLYQKVEYIESTGTQYIDSGIYPSNTTQVVLAFSNFVYTNNSYLFRDSGPQDSNAYGLFVYNNAISAMALFGNATESLSIVSSILQNANRHTINFSQSGLFIDDALIGSISTKTFTGSTVLRILVSGTYGPSLRLYTSQIYDLATPVRNFIPCYRKADGKIGLFDLINGVFYTNQGTGTFLKGPDI